MKYLRLIYAILFCLFGCPKAYSTGPGYTDLLKKNMKEFAVEMKINHSLSFTDCGGRYSKEQIHSITLSFDWAGNKSLEELRELMVMIIEEYLNKINRDEEIRKYLVNYPFAASNIHFCIILVDHSGNIIKNKGSSKKFLSGVILVNEKMYYHFFNDEMEEVQIFFEEPYSEAYEIVKNEHPDFLNPKREIIIYMNSIGSEE